MDAPDTPTRPSLSRAESAPPTSVAKTKKPHMLRQASYRNSIPHDKMPYMLSQRFASVVLLEVSGVHADYLRPWQKGSQNSWSGSGFAIEGRRILTNFHVTSESTDIRIRKHGSSKRFRGRIVCQGQDVDLAVVEVVEDTDTFWEGVPAVSFAQALPPLQSSVNVVGYPTGGRTICVTEGVVSRVDCKNYRITGSATAAPGRILVVQIDAAINGGNSGGPVFDDVGLVSGVAFQGMGGDVQNVGYVIPACIAVNFLQRVELAGGGPYIGIADVPFQCDSLQNKSLRKYLGVPPGVSGVVVTDVAPLNLVGGAEAADFLLEDDVVTHIDGKSVGDDFTVPLRGDELVAADFLVTSKPTGEVTTFDVLRAKQPLRISAELRPLVPMLPRTHELDAWPNWQLIGGLLFVPLTCPLLDEDNRRLYAHGAGMIMADAEKLMHSFRKELGTEVIVLISIMVCDTSFGYDHNCWRILKSLNGEKVRNMGHLHAMYKAAQETVVARADAGADTDAEADTPFLRFVFEDKSRIVLETKSCMDSEEELLVNNGLPCAASDAVIAAAAAEAAGGSALASRDDAIAQTRKATI